MLDKPKYILKTEIKKLKKTKSKRYKAIVASCALYWAVYTLSTSLIVYSVLTDLNSSIEFLQLGMCLHFLCDMVDYKMAEMWKNRKGEDAFKEEIATIQKSIDAIDKMNHRVDTFKERMTKGIEDADRKELAEGVAESLREDIEYVQYMTLCENPLEPDFEKLNEEAKLYFEKVEDYAVYNESRDLARRELPDELASYLEKVLDKELAYYFEECTFDEVWDAKFGKEEEEVEEKTDEVEETVEIEPVEDEEVKVLVVEKEDGTKKEA